MEAPAVPPARPLGPATTSPRKVLVVDDVPEICRVMKLACERLAQPKVDVTIVTNAEEAVQLLTRAKFDLVVSDFRMPRADGLRVLRAARCGNPRGFRWLMTGFNEVPAAPDEVRAAGLDAVIQKPIPTALLFRLVEGTLSGNMVLVRRLREEAEQLVYTNAIEPGAPASLRIAGA
ncbi:MAG TPA: response regulator [Candidatus Thermoplasmatota archaeon]|nr:response regulator [Candidatus Thermoplasmatota archaeon]